MGSFERTRVAVVRDHRFGWETRVVGAVDSRFACPGEIALGSAVADPTGSVVAAPKDSAGSRNLVAAAAVAFVAEHNPGLLVLRMGCMNSKDIVAALAAPRKTSVGFELGRAVAAAAAAAELALVRPRHRRGSWMRKGVRYWGYRKKCRS